MQYILKNDSGYSFSFSDAGGDFVGTVNVKEYEYLSKRPNELILEVGSKQYLLNNDIKSVSAEAHEETSEKVSVGKSLGKLALAGLAGNSISKKNYGTAGVLASASHAIDTKKMVTTKWHNIIIQFNDEKLLSLPKVDNDVWKKFLEAVKVFAYEKYFKLDNEVIAYSENAIAETRQNIGSLVGNKKEDAMKVIEASNKIISDTQLKRIEIRKIAIRKNLIKDDLTQEEQSEVGVELQRRVKEGLKQLGVKDFNKLEKLTDFEFARATKYSLIGEEMSKQRPISEKLVLIWITAGLYLIFMKRDKSKKIWKQKIEGSKDALSEFKKFREGVLKQFAELT